MNIYCKQQGLNIDWHCDVGSVMVCLFCLHITQEVKAVRDMDQKQLWWYTMLNCVQSSNSD